MTPDLISRAGGHHHKRRREPCSWRSRPHALAAALSDSEMLGPGEKHTVELEQSALRAPRIICLSRS